MASALTAPTLVRAETVGAWTIDRTTSPLTNAQTVTATLPSVEMLYNTIDRPERAALILRCKDGALNTYIAWPTVLARDSSSVILSLPQTLVLKRIDDGPIQSELWGISDGGDAAGGFETRSASKILSTIEAAKRLAVRLHGRTPQDASFDLTEIGAAAGAVREACGMGASKSTQGLPMQEAVFGAAVSAPLRGRHVSSDAVQAFLTAQGWQIANVDPIADTVTTTARPMRLSTGQADCGRYAGLPYLIDRRAETTVTCAPSLAEGRLRCRRRLRGATGLAQLRSNCGANPRESLRLP